MAQFPSTSGASGIWSLKEQRNSVMGSNWPVAPTVPDAPTSVSATGGNAQATVTFTAPASNGGSAITSYTVTSTPGNITATGSSSPITITGLTNGTAYTFKVKALNAVGFGAESTASNSVTPSAMTAATSIETLVVAGGGTGGEISVNRAAGGGAGGLIYIPSFPVAAGTYTVTVGLGGSSSSGTAVSNGANSVLAGNGRTLTANGGGRGGNGDNTNNGAAGGSGGGQWYQNYAGAAATQPSTTNDGISTYASTGFGNAGGTSGSSQPFGSGGGGAGAAGSDFNAGTGPTGGIGKQYTQFSPQGANTNYFAGGGSSSGFSGGAGYAEYAGGLGGGGIGSGDSYDVISNGTANTGGGGGSGGSGGSGIVIVRYPDNFFAASATTGSPTITVSGGYRMYVFTGNGSITF